MFAILITFENLPKILEHQQTVTLPHLYEEVYLESSRPWYYVRGFVGEGGKFAEWACLPEYVLVRDFEFDPHKIKSDWDQIVRK
jgi:hypothetical protein